MEERNGHSNAVGWFVLGSLAGACTALLLAPATGKRTRDRLTRGLRRTRESVTDFADDLVDTTRHIAEKAGRMSEKAVRLASDASASAREVVGSLGSNSPAKR